MNHLQYKTRMTSACSYFPLKTLSHNSMTPPHEFRQIVAICSLKRGRLICAKLTFVSRAPRRDDDFAIANVTTDGDAVTGSS